MKKQIFTTLVFAFVCFSFVAQINKKSKEKIRALKVAFITQELDLSTKVAQKFWPVYNKHEENLESLRNQGRTEVRKKLKNSGGFETLTEEEAKSFVSFKIEIEKKILIEKETFLSNIAKVLPYKKILKLQLSEREFARKLMRKYGRKQK